MNWNDATFTFDKEIRLNLVYKAITTDDDGHLEIKNPGDARKFVGLLDTGYAVDIESGLSIHDLPDLDDLKESGKLKRIKRFISFVEKNSFNTEEMNHLSELLTSLEHKLGGQ